MKRWWRKHWCDVLLAALVAAGCAAAPAGCANRAMQEPRRAQDAANALAGVEAAAQAVDEAKDAAGANPAALAPLSDAADILRGVASFVRAGAPDPKQLPAPTAPAAGVRHDPAAYVKAGDDALREASGGQFLALLIAGASIAGAGLIAISKNLPGVAGIAGNLADSLWTALAPRSRRQAQERLEGQADALTHAVQYGRAVETIAMSVNPNAVRALRDRAAEVQDAVGARPYIDGALRAIKDGIRGNEATRLDRAAEAAPASVQA